MTTDLKVIADEVARALSYGRVRGSSAYVTTAVTYPNGTAAVVRIDEDRDGFFVSDDGYGAFIAETMAALNTYIRLAPAVAKTAGLHFDQRSMFSIHVPRERLPGAVAAIANASNRAVERTVFAVERQKEARSREVFDQHIREAFGKRAQFEVHVRGATGREWDYAAGVIEGSRIITVFDLVSPTYGSVASANLKITDTRTLDDAPRITVALSDYDRTEPAFRSILSVSADAVIAVNDDVERYRQAA